jgi:phosphohistidine phosphatase
MPASQKLWILRHAKSSWDDPDLPDHDRPLAPRGKRAASAIAGYIRQAGIAPALVLCSTATRARETLERVKPDGEWMMEPELYGADVADLLGRLRLVPEGIPSVMMIGHNPAMQMLVVALAGEHGAVAEKFPTGALAALEVGCAWSQLAPGRARLVDFVRPRDLQ